MAATKKHAVRPPDAGYLGLVRRHPLRTIRTAAQYEAAAAMLDELAGRPDLTPGESEYLDVLSTLVEAYDDEHEDSAPAVAPLELLRALMEHRGMTTTGLGQLFGSKGVASEVLNGKRPLNLNQMYKLAGHFGVSPAAFIDGAAVPRAALAAHRDVAGRIGSAGASPPPAKRRVAGTG